MTKEPGLARDPNKSITSFTTTCSQSVPSTHIPNEVTSESDSSKWLSLTPKSSTLSDRPRACRRRTSSTLRSAPLISRESPSSTSRATRSSSRPRPESESSYVVYVSDGRGVYDWWLCLQLEQGNPREGVPVRHRAFR